MRRFVIFLFALAMVACSTDEPSDENTEAVYAPCYGETSACRLATVHGDSNGPESCLCTHYCDVDADCPIPATGSAVATCRPFGDYVVNGHTASCVLPCDSTVTCPDGMVCEGGECWAPITN